MCRRLRQIAVSLSAVQAMIGGGLYLWFAGAGLSITGAPLSVDGTNAAWAVVDYMYRALAGIWFTLGIMRAFIIPSMTPSKTAT
jgi:hypothetical protein